MLPKGRLEMIMGVRQTSEQRWPMLQDKSIAFSGELRLGTTHNFPTSPAALKRFEYKWLGESHAAGKIDVGKNRLFEGAFQQTHAGSDREDKSMNVR